MNDEMIYEMDHICSDCLWRQIVPILASVTKGAFLLRKSERGSCLNPNYPHSRRILLIKSKSGFLRFTTSAFFLGKDLKKVLLTSGFP